MPLLQFRDNKKCKKMIEEGKSIRNLIGILKEMETCNLSAKVL